jgi:F-type H+-transporting ATPase subunit delta
VKNLAIARRYAKALLLIGKEDGEAETYRSELSGISNLIGQNQSLQQAITNPLHDAGARKRVLETVVDRLGLSKVMRSFLLLLFDKGRIGFIGSIDDFYQKLVDELKGVARATVTSATELSSDAIEKIRKGLSRRTGKKIILEINQDPGLIGGIVTRIGDLVLDGSIKTQLLGMRESFKRGEGV